MVGEGCGDLLVDVVLDVQVTAVARRACDHGGIPQVQTNLDLARISVEVSLGVEIEVGDVVTEVHHLLLTLGSANGEGRAHVSRVEAKNIHKGDLVIHHLVLALRQCHLVEVLVRPRVAGDLVTFVKHALPFVRWAPCFKGRTT